MISNWEKYILPTCGLAHLQVAYPWFKNWHFAYIWSFTFNPVTHLPLKKQIITNHISLSSHAISHRKNPPNCFSSHMWEPNNTSIQYNKYNRQYSSLTNRELGQNQPKVNDRKLILKNRESQIRSFFFKVLNDEQVDWEQGDVIFSSLFTYSLALAGATTLTRFHFAVTTLVNLVLNAKWTPLWELF